MRLSVVAPFAVLLVAAFSGSALAADPRRALAADPPREPASAPRGAPAASPSPSPSPSPGPTVRWRSIGPAVSGGRVATVAGTDLDPALLYAGAAGGGVWRSTNGGIDWSPVFDSAGTQSIGAIAISPRDKNDVWVGTGEPWPRNDVIPGDGVYHSTDGGKTWAHRGLARTAQIARVLLDPRDPKRVLVAALGDPFGDNPERGVFRSTDGGQTWTKTLYVGPSAGASDLAMDPKNPDVLYAGMWRFRRSSWRLTSGGDDDGIYKSTDGGATWKRLTGNGLPAGMTGRIALAIAPSDARRIYALIESKDGLLWRSDDGGATWTMTSSNTLINERPFYYSRIVVDPHDANHLFSVSVLLAESTNGGKTWHVSGKRLHGDHHDLWISADGRNVLEANDGGVALSHDAGATWTWRNVLPIAQVYHVAYDLRSPYFVCGGLQDNGAWCAPTRTGDDRGVLARDWFKVAGGDGTWVVPNPRDPSTIWTTAGGGDNQGEMLRYDGRTRNVVDVSPYLRDQNVVLPSRLKYRFNWETPIAFDPFDARAVYTGGNVVFRSTDAGMRWTPISPDLTRAMPERQILSGGPLTLDVTGAETFDTILSVAPSPLARGQIWVSTDDGLVQLTRDGGAHWANVSIPGVDADGRIPALEPSHRAAGTAYAVVDRHYAGDRAPYVYVTANFGRSWRKIVNGLPASEVHVVREDPRDPNVLYAGTGKGVWWTTDAGASWRAFPAPLPAVEVRDLAVQPVSGDLIAATHGRGIYVFDDLGALRERATAAVARLFRPRDALPLQRYTPTVNDRGADDAPQAAFTFWQQAPAKTAPAFEIADARGKVVRRIAETHDEDGEAVPNVPNAAGYNRVAWALDADPPTPWRRIAKWDRGPENGPPVPSGTYTVRMRRDGATYEQKIRVLRDRRLASAADELRGYRFQTAMFDELSALDDALNGLDNVRVQLPERIAALKDAALAGRARGVLAEAKRIEDTISSQPVNDQDDDFLEDLLRERVLTFISNFSPGPPSAAMIAEGAALRRQGASAVAAYRAFVERQVRPLNDALRAAGSLAVDLNAIPPAVKPDPNADEHARRGESH
ncbi:MAG TPA: hypothetical protein VGD01_14115 [Candidatus Elarobacter sp.]|jgi:photosystem II stability/assembly factor-like uncharacterized protein